MCLQVWPEIERNGFSDKALLLEIDDDDVLTLEQLKSQLYYDTVNYIKTCNIKVF